MIILAPVGHPANSANQKVTEENAFVIHNFNILLTKYKIGLQVIITFMLKKCLLHDHPLIVRQEGNSFNKYYLCCPSKKTTTYIYIYLQLYSQQKNVFAQLLRKKKNVVLVSFNSGEFLQLYKARKREIQYQAKHFHKNT